MHHSHVKSADDKEKLRYITDLVESAAHCIISTDKNGLIASINHAGEKMYGYRADELIGKPLAMLYSGLVSRESLDKMRRMAQIGEAWEAESMGKRKNGENFPIWIAAVYFKDESGKINGAVGISRDLTKFKEAEEKLRYMANLVESAAHCIISTDKNGLIVSINKAGEEMLGYKADELIGKPVSVIQSDRIPTELRERLERLSKEGEAWEAEGLGKRKNGEIFPIWIATSYLKDERGEIKGAVGISRDLTKFKESEEKLRYMANLVESAAHCIISTDKNASIVSINKAGEKMFGYRADELIGKPVSVLHSDRIPVALRERLERLSAKGESWEAESIGKRKNGEIFPIWIATSYLRDESGAIKGAVGISRDLTKFRGYEEKLRYMSELVESAAHCIISMDMEGIVTSINHAGQQMFGYTAEELIGKHVSVLDPPGGFATGLFHNFCERLKRGETWEAEGLAIRKSGEVFPLWISTSCLKDEAGNIRGSVGISRDMSLLQQYKQMTGYMAELVEKASLGIISTDPQNNIVSVNKAAEAMYGYGADEIIGKPINIVYSDRNPEDLLQRIQEKADRLQPWSAELYRRRKDGSEFISWLSTAYIYGPMGNLKAKVCIERDVTEQREMEKRLAEAKNLASIGELAAGVAHEIRNPLGGILASARMLLDQKGQVIGEDEISLMSIVEKEAKRLEGIVTDFLRFGRPQEPIFSVVDINRAVGELISSLKREKIIGSGIEVMLELLPEPVAVHLDENQMKQVFLNLVINAEHAMGGKGKLIVRIVSRDDVVDISVEDTGGGISREDLQNVFRPFFSRKKGGTGLGLAIVSRIVAAHNGSIHCKSELGKGTKFTISLPIVK